MNAMLMIGELLTTGVIALVVGKLFVNYAWKGILKLFVVTDTLNEPEVQELIDYMNNRAW